MMLQNLSTAKLEAMEVRNTRTIRALKSWANRALSTKKRIALIEDLRIQQDAIITELMSRENEGK